jgi:hypothetical protein
LETSRIPATPFPRSGQKCFLPVFIFPGVLQKRKVVFAAARENERTRGAKRSHGVLNCAMVRAEQLLKCVNLPLPGILKSVFF